MVQHRRTPNPAYYVGRGKAEALRELVGSVDADVVICDGDLSPGQVRKLEELTRVKVIDRTELILDIFATRARSSQARLQVELAQLEYSFPRLKAMWRHLERIEGGIGTRGPGEQQLEMDRRLVRRRISTLRAKLREIEARTERQVDDRTDFVTASLVGYTNAGKSTLMNAATGPGAFVEDRLFATLDTRTRLWDLGRGRRVFLSDTVGFIRNLPHRLVASFHATLAEARRADVLLHVVDVSHPDVLHQVESVDAVLEEIGCGGRRCITVLNKCDLLESETDRVILQGRAADSVLISAKTGRGMDALCGRLAQLVDEQSVRARLQWDAGDGRVFPFMAAHATVLDHAYEGSTETATVMALPRVLGQVGKRFGNVTFLEGFDPRAADEALLD